MMLKDFQVFIYLFIFYFVYDCNYMELNILFKCTDTFIMQLFHTC